MSRTITLTQADEKQAARWTDDHDDKTWDQGWIMADYDGTGALQIQRLDEGDIFDSDDAAITFIKAQAAAGCETAKLALELDRYFEPIIYGSDWVSKIHTEA